MYSNYEIKLEEDREEISDLVYKIISASRSDYTEADFYKFKDQLSMLKSRFEQTKNEIINEDHNGRLLQICEFYSKNISDIENTHMRTLELSKVHFK